jgi:hypothetical protein
MIVDRWTYIMKQGKWNELEALFKAERERYGSMFDRIYVCQIGNRGRLAVETEFEDLADMQKKMTEFKLSPGLYEEFVALTEAGTTREIWRVE